MGVFALPAAVLELTVTVVTVVEDPRLVLFLCFAVWSARGVGAACLASWTAGECFTIGDALGRADLGALSESSSESESGMNLRRERGAERRSREANA